MLLHRPLAGWRILDGGHKAMVIDYTTPGAPTTPTTTQPAGSDLLIRGGGFGSTGTVEFGTIPATVVSWTPTLIRVTVPAQSSYPIATPVIVAPAAGLAYAGPNLTVTAYTYPNKAAEFSVNRSLSKTSPSGFGDLSAGLTVCGWLWTNSNTNGYFYLGRWRFATNQKQFSLFDTTLGNVKYLTSHDGSTETGAGAGAVAAAPSTQWNFVCATTNLVTNIDSVAVNNGAAGTRARAGAGLFASTSPLELGGIDAGNFLSGRLDSVGIWNRVLTAAEQTWLYNGGVGRAYFDLVLHETILGGLISWYDLDEANGTATWVDRMGLNNLTNNNAVTTVAGKR